MNLAEYLMNAPKTLEERRIETCKHYRQEKNKLYKRKKRERERERLKNVSVQSNG